MKTFCCVVLFLLLAAMPQSAHAEALDGRWHGELEAGGTTLRIELIFETDNNGALQATLDSPDQGRTGMPITRLSVEDDTLRAEIAYLGAVYQGTLDEAKTKIAGQWQQGGNSLPLTLHKGNPPPQSHFPRATPESVGMDSTALDILASRVQEMVQQEEIVGGELLVIKNRRTVLRRAFGWKDREAKEPLEVDALYCIRSMTKPVVGTAIQILLDEGWLRLDTPVHEVLPSFAGPQKDTITVDNLLTHTAGFPFSTITRPLAEYSSLHDVATEAAAADLEFEPGSGFSYSDASSDVLGAMIATVTGEPVERFIQDRILRPLGMADTVVLLGKDPEALERVPSAYSGGTGHWSRHWESGKAPLFPVFLASQSLYSTTTDYARFLELWLDHGKAGEKQLLSQDAVSRALTPQHSLRSSKIGDAHYGQHWVIYGQDQGSAAPVNFKAPFGHDGSDGTHAWAWPEQDLMVLFFTQSRGTLAGIGLEGIIQSLLIDRDTDDPALATATTGANEPGQFAGMYWDETNEAAYYIVKTIGERLMLERPGKTLLAFRASEVPGRFVHEAIDDVWIEFIRDSTGAVSAMKTSFRGNVEVGPRHVPDKDLPTVDQVVSMVLEAHVMDRLKNLGVVRMEGSMRFERTGQEGTITQWFDAKRSRNTFELGASRETVVVNEGRAWAKSPNLGVEELEGSRLEQALLDRFPVTFGDWRQHFEGVEVLKRVHARGRDLLLVRVVPRKAPGSTMIVDELSGRVVLSMGLVQLPGVGFVGFQSRFTDLRDVDGMQLPFKTIAKFESPMIGTVVTQLERAETGLSPKAEVFEAPSKDD